MKKQNLKLETASISVHVLMINNRKLTLSVFRQIPYQNLLDETYIEDKKEAVLGWVNYFWNGNEGDIHILWTYGGMLYRSVLCRISYKRLLHELNDNYYRFSINNKHYSFDLKMAIKSYQKGKKKRDNPFEKYTLENIEDAVNENNLLIDEISQMPQLFIAV